MRTILALYKVDISLEMNPHSIEVKVGDVIEIKRVITVMEIDNVKKQIKMKWKDKLGKEKVQWVTYKMFAMF
jgi:uncharacterized protein YigE (DUF2233 family)